MRRNLPPGDKTIAPLGLIRRFRRDPLGFLSDQFHRYGDLVTVPAPFYRPYFLVNDPHLIHQILVVQAAHFQKSSMLKGLFRAGFGTGLIFSDGSFWRRQRKLIQPAFHHQRVKAYGTEMVQHTLAMLARWQDGQRRDIAAEMRALTLMIFVDTIFRADLASQTTRIIQAVNTFFEVVGQQLYRPVLALWPEWTPIPALQRKRHAIAVLDEIVYRLIAERRARPGRRNDLISTFLAAEDAETGERLTDAQIRDEIMTLLVTGHEAVGLLLIWILILLSRHPDIEAKLHAELAATLGGRPPAVDDLPHLPYTGYIVKEALRLYPPTWGFLREAATPLDLGPLPLRKGDTVWLTPYLIQRDPRYFDRPDHFWPDRFAPDETGRSLEQRLPRYAYYPFGGGPRICLGNGFAMLEAPLLLATIAQHYRLRLPPGHRIELKVGSTLGVEGAVPMQLSKRR